MKKKTTFMQVPPVEQEDDRDAALHYSHEVWTHFQSLHPQLYLPDRAPLQDYGTSRRDRHWWRPRELQHFDSVVQTRTQYLLAKQEALQRYWVQAAIVVQRYVRGWLARLLAARLEADHELKMLQAAQARERRLRRRQRHRAACCLQRCFRRHQAFLLYVSRCRLQLQHTVRCFLMRQRRIRASRVIQRTYRQYRRRVQLWATLHTVMRLLRASRQREQLQRAATQFQAARAAAKVRARHHQQRLQPRQTMLAHRVRQRKRQLLHGPGANDTSLQALPALSTHSSMIAWSSSVPAPSPTMSSKSNHSVLSVSTPRSAARSVLPMLSHTTTQ